ncbi:hypothetical protein [Cytobacillus gottheilii]|uniref:hypothetical protein n=1 Tax=Cytobacillus gottheilii TaxID=859144 RepID=UPI0011180058|nr:hypothetical protein [Cytobacillus gottheilii]
MDHQHHHNHNHKTGTGSEVVPKVSYVNGELIIELRDRHNQIPKLEVSHEKYMHLIVVSSDLEQYHHLHPQQAGEGVYKKEVHLAPNSYKAFVDIAPAELQYEVTPIEFHAGEGHHGHSESKLAADTDFVKTINGKAVELTPHTFEVNKEIAFHFDVKDEKPEAYLGALGHVVILDEAGEKYIHVHPASADKAVFQTQFDEPGLYKLWAEFKFGGQVHAYPYVIEVRNSK